MKARKFKYIEPWPIKEDTPWQKKRQIHQAEWAAERLLAAIFKFVYGFAGVAIIVAILCMADCYGLIELF